jgi:hypothetical protein
MVGECVPGSVECCGLVSRAVEFTSGRLRCGTAAFRGVGGGTSQIAFCLCAAAVPDAKVITVGYLVAMTETYWIRKPGGSGYFGPMTTEHLREKLAGGIFGATHEARLAVPGAASEVLDDRGWQPVWRLLGLPEPVARRARHKGSERIEELRAASRYPTLRSLVKLVTTVAFAVLGVLALVGLGAALHEGFLGVLFVLGAAALQACAILLGYHLVHLLIDIADCQLRADDDREARREAAKD